MAIDFPKLWVPPKPAIIRNATPPPDVAAFLKEERRKRAFGVAPMFCPSGGSPAVLPTIALSDTMQVDTGSTSTTTYTWPTRAIGAADPTRFVVVLGFHPTASNTLTCTLNGVGAPALTTQASNDYNCAFGLAMPTGTTADVRLNSAGGGRYWEAFVFSIYNLNSTTPVDTVNAHRQPGGTASFSYNTNTLSGGVLIVYVSVNGALPGFTWSDGLTNSQSKQVGTTSNIGYGRWTDGTATETPRVMSAVPSVTSSTLSWTTVSFR